MKFFTYFFLLYISLISLALAQASFEKTTPFRPNISGVTPTFKLLETYNQSTLYTAQVEGYEEPIFFLDLHANSRYDLGYAYGNFIGRDL